MQNESRAMVGERQGKEDIYPKSWTKKPYSQPWQHDPTAVATGSNLAHRHQVDLSVRVSGYWPQWMLKALLCLSPLSSGGLRWLDEGTRSTPSCSVCQAHAGNLRGMHWHQALARHIRLARRDACSSNSKPGAISALAAPKAIVTRPVCMTCRN